jgi:transcriptional regulator with XRE-family HTH domain
VAESRQGHGVIPARRSSHQETAHRRVVGSRIRELRDSRGWTQLELASRAEMHRPYLTGVETGSRNPSLDVLVRIANALHVPLIELFREPTGRKP